MEYVISSLMQKRKIMEDRIQTAILPVGVFVQKARLPVVVCRRPTQSITLPFLRLESQGCAANPSLAKIRLFCFDLSASRCFSRIEGEVYKSIWFPTNVAYKTFRTLSIIECKWQMQILKQRLLQYEVIWGHIDISVVAVRRLSRRWKVKTLLAGPSPTSPMRRRLPTPLFPTLPFGNRSLQTPLFEASKLPRLKLSSSPG